MTARRRAAVLALALALAPTFAPSLAARELAPVEQRIVAHIDGRRDAAIASLGPRREHPERDGEPRRA